MLFRDYNKSHNGKSKAVLNAKTVSLQKYHMSNADSGLLVHLKVARERAKEDAEQLLKRMEEENAKRAANITQKFTANYDVIEESLKASTIGLVTLDEMKEKQIDAIKAGENKIVLGEVEERVKKDEASNEKSIAQKRVLSFAFDEEEDEEEAFVPKKRLGMDPNVDTTFLPDKDREEALIKEKERLASEWKAQQEKEKQEEVTVSYCYWDGSSHQKRMIVKKGMTIGQFLGKAIESFKSEFTALRTASPEGLMFIKEDLIIPHFYTFQDFIVARKMGKTGPLYEFDAAGDVRIHQGLSKDVAQSHPAKVCLRSWYERNKHIYPASRWEPFTPNKVYSLINEDLSIL